MADVGDSPLLPYPVSGDGGALQAQQSCGAGSTPLRSKAPSGGGKTSKGRKRARGGRKKASKGGPKGRAQSAGIEAESGRLLCASYNADRLTKALWRDLCMELEARDVLVCAVLHECADW